jgi:putative oxidoreductase
MAVAYFMFHMPRSFWPGVNQGEDAILFCFIFFYLVFVGAGPCSLEAAIARRRSV